MGYYTKFEGSFSISPPLTLEDQQWLLTFQRTRHEDPSMPGIWCQWIPKEVYENRVRHHSFTELAWDEKENFYDYVEWLQYLIRHVFFLKGYILNGIVKWQGSDVDDRGKITVVDNTVTVVNLE